MTAPCPLLALALAGLAGCIPYRPQPIEPPRLEQEFRNRSLHDAGLRAFVGLSTPWPPATLDLDSLARVALYYSPAARVARAQAQVAQAQVVAAGARPNPDLAVESGHSRNPEAAALFKLLPGFTIETAGKRGYRILQAQRLAEAAGLASGEAGWQARSRVRAALAASLFSHRRRELLRGEERLRAEIVRIFDKRLEAGEAARPELDLFRIELLAAQGALQAAEGDVNTAFAALAGAAGVPVSALEGTPIRWLSLDAPPPEDQLPWKSVQRAGLLHRADVRRLVAEYAAADAALRLEVARQYPDLQIGPSYSFEEGFSRYVLAGGLAPLPVFHRNRGRIGVAEAQRVEAKTRVEAAQAEAIGDIERALARYRAAHTEWREAARRLAAVQRDREQATLKSFAAGETDRLAVFLARLQSNLAARAQLDALERAQSALGALEDAVQQPLEKVQP
ncbi:MAG: TolC family protein [Acidobacteria bacterium]|nr:TolC family protein [Acidobacteriota bacterium]